MNFLNGELEGINESSTGKAICKGKEMFALNICGNLYGKWWQWQKINLKPTQL